MEIEQTRWDGSDEPPPRPRLRDAQLVLVFGDRRLLASGVALRELRQAYPRARIVGASTAGEIAGLDVLEGTVVATAVQFARTRVGCVTVRLDEVGGSYEAGSFLARSLPHEELAHVMVFADGTTINGTALVRGLRHDLPAHVQVTGGLAGDGERFGSTCIVGDRDVAQAGAVCVIGLYGPAVRVSYGSLGGWDPFGVARVITRSDGNVVHEIDDRPALDVYKELLGERAHELPAAGLLHPMLVQTSGTDFVRTLLGIDERRRSLTFAGDVPQGERAYFMRANFERLVQGAEGAAIDAQSQVPGDKLAVLISCVGRRMVLKERTPDEVAAVSKVLGGTTTLAGFYSYGEVCPVARDASCTLHNQTMTITVVAEEPDPR